MLDLSDTKNNKKYISDDFFGFYIRVTRLNNDIYLEEYIDLLLIRSTYYSMNHIPMKYLYLKLKEVK